MLGLCEERLTRRVDLGSQCGWDMLCIFACVVWTCSRRCGRKRIVHCILSTRVAILDLHAL